MWIWWQEFWGEWVPAVTKGEDYVVVNNGDLIDGVHHNSVTQITHNVKDQKIIGRQVLEPVLADKRCKGLYFIRGTEAHVGKSGQYEEEIAEALGAIPDEIGNYARWELWLKMSDALVHFTHHMGNTSSAAYESTGVYKELIEAYNESGRWRDRPPDVVCRSHRHRQLEIRIATEMGYGIVFVTPGWQLKTPFTYKMGLGRNSAPMIGGYLIRCGAEEHVYTRFKVWKIQKTKTVVL